MYLLRHIILAASLLTSANARPSLNQERSPSPNVDNSFRARLASVSDSSLHAALHFVHPAYKDGVFDDDRTAAQKIHKRDPVLAERILLAAIPDLAKRQDVAKRQNVNANTSTSSNDQGQTRSTIIHVTSVIATVTSTEITHVSGPPTTVRTTILRTLTSKLKVISTAITSVVESTPSSSLTPVQSRPSSSSATPSSTPHTSSSHTSTRQPVVASTPTSILLETAPGGQSTVLSTALKTATASELPALTETDQVTQGSSASPTVSSGAVFSTGRKPALQTGGANAAAGVIGKEFLAVMGGAVGVAWLL